MATVRHRFAHPGGGTCVYCNRKLKKSNAWHRDGYTDGLATTRDHSYPSSAGGTRVVDCCRACNIVKGNLTPREWDAFMAKHPRWWNYYPRKNATTVIREEVSRDIRSGD